MTFWHYLAENWSHLIEYTGIIGGLLFSGIATLSDRKTRQTSNDLEFTKGHREIWLHYLNSPALGRTLNDSVDLSADPVKPEEQIFINLVILHLNTVFHAKRNKQALDPEGLEPDIEEFFSKPIPFAVWRRMKRLHNLDFVTFVDTCLQSGKALHEEVEYDL